jgi:hypothetical protein
MTPSAYDQWLALFEASATRDATSRRCPGSPRAPVYGPRTPTTPSTPGSSPTPAACTPRCTAVASGPCACSRALAPRSTPTSASRRSSRPAVRDSPRPLTCRPARDSTPTTRWPWAKSGAAAWRSTRSRRHARPLRRHRPRPDHDLDDDQLPGRGHARALRRPGRGVGRRARPNSAARCRTTS